MILECKASVKFGSWHGCEISKVYTKSGITYAVLADSVCNEELCFGKVDSFEVMDYGTCYYNSEENYILKAN